MASELFVGLISGTSMDAIDAALVDFGEGLPQLRASYSHPWPADLRIRLQQLASGEPCALDELGRADAAAGEEFALAVQGLLAQAGVSGDQVLAIGSHGQTLHHGPDGQDGFTLQIGDPNRIAERTRITTVADLRRRDIAVGGQGAPLVSAFHHAFLADPQEDRAVLNIGGIANLTLLPAGDGAPRGFDTGPGNCLLDGWIQRHQGMPFDLAGRWARSGRLVPELRDQLLADPYFGAPLPKSTGTQYFSTTWLAERLDDWDSAAPEDVQATLAALTVQSVSEALQRSQPDTQRLLVCGGGRHNEVLMSGLADAMPGTLVTGTETMGIDPDNLEAMAFAWLAMRALRRESGNLPGVTGAQRPVVLGGIYPA